MTLTGKYLLFFLIILLLVISPIASSAHTESTTTTYYVSSTIGNDSNPGTRDLPWKNCPGMIGWSGTGILAPGDVVYFKNADTWEGSDIPEYGQFFELKGGVTYDGRTWGTAHNKATIACTASDGRCACVLFSSDHSTSPTVFDGFSVIPIGSASGICIDYPAEMSNQIGAAKRIQNCIVNGAGQNVDETYGITIQPYGGRTVKNVEILNNTVLNCWRDGIYIYPGNEARPNIVTDVTIRNNDCYMNGKSPTSTGSGIKLKNHVVRALIEYNYIHDNYGAGIVFDSGDMVPTGPEDCTVRYNLVMNGKSVGGRSAFWILSHTDMSTSAWIYGNIFWNPLFTKGIYLDSALANNSVKLHLHNNIIYNDGPAIYIEPNNPNATIKFCNNILIANSGNEVLYLQSSANVKDHQANIYWRINGGNLVTIKNGQTIYNAENLVSWEPSAFSTDPNFKNPSNLPTGFIGNIPNTNGLSIVSGNAIGHGTNLGYPYYSSINGVFRGTAWDIGAYQTPIEVEIGKTRWILPWFSPFRYLNFPRLSQIFSFSGLLERIDSDVWNITEPILRLRAIN